MYSTLHTVASGVEKLQNTVEPARLVAESDRHEGCDPSAMQERRVKRRRAAHREVRAVPEVLRGLAGEVRSWRRQPQRLHCIPTRHNCELVLSV